MLSLPGFQWQYQLQKQRVDLCWVMLMKGALEIDPTQGKEEEQWDFKQDEVQNERGQ